MAEKLKKKSLVGWMNNLDWKEFFRENSYYVPQIYYSELGRKRKKVRITISEIK